MTKFFGVKGMVKYHEFKDEWWHKSPDGSLFLTNDKDFAEEVKNDARMSFAPGASFVYGTEIDFWVEEIKPMNKENEK